MFELSRRQRFVVAVLLVAFGVGGVVLVARRLAGGDVVVMPGPPAPLADGQRVEAAERGEPVKGSSDGGTVTVHVCGAVTTPGVYTLPSGSRVADAVRFAGGLAPGACPELVNMAKVLSDSVQVYIPMKPATESGAGTSSGAGSAAVCTEPSRMSETDHMRVNINTASLAELDSLPGIGPALARRIIEHRNAKGRFERPEQLTDVPGIGPRKYDAMKDLVTVN